jgi:UDP-glucose 4-epimerase
MFKAMFTGPDGYIGTQLARNLVKCRYEYTVADCLFFRMETLAEFINNKKLSVVQAELKLW